MPPTPHWLGWVTRGEGRIRRGGPPTRNFGAPDDVIKAVEAEAALERGGENGSVSVFPVRHEGITVSVTVPDSAVKVAAHPRR